MDLMQTRIDLGAILTARLGDTIVGYEGVLIVGRRTLMPSTGAIEIVGTQDGLGTITNEWHTGPAGEAVYYERYTFAGRVAHGWVDAKTRRLVQAG